MLMFRLTTLIDNGFDMPPGMQIQTTMKIHDRGPSTSSYNHFNCHNLTKPYRSNTEELKNFSMVFGNFSRLNHLLSLNALMRLQPVLFLLAYLYHISVFTTGLLLQFDYSCHQPFIPLIS
jgi:hypothetical protein